MLFTTNGRPLYDSIMSQCEVFHPNFTKIAENLLGSEGPVFDRHGNFFMVAPEVMDGDKYAGEVLKIDLETGKVPSTFHVPCFQPAYGRKTLSFLSSETGMQTYVDCASDSSETFEPPRHFTPSRYASNRLFSTLVVSGSMLYLWTTLDRRQSKTLLTIDKCGSKTS